MGTAGRRKLNRHGHLLFEFPRPDPQDLMGRILVGNS